MGACGTTGHACIDASLHLPTFQDIHIHAHHIPNLLFHYFFISYLLYISSKFKPMIRFNFFIYFLFFCVSYDQSQYVNNI